MDWRNLFIILVGFISFLAVSLFYTNSILAYSDNFSSIKGVNSKDTLINQFSPELFAKADSLFNLNMFEAAHAEYLKVLDTTDLNIEINDKFNYYNKLGFSYRVLLQYDTALIYFNRCLRLIDENAGLREELIADNYYYLGQFYDRMMMPDSAIKFHHKSIDLKLKIYGESSNELALSYLGLGDVYRYIFYDFNLAEEHYVEAYNIIKYDTASSGKDLAIILGKLGETNRLKGDFDQALIYTKKSLQVNYTLKGNFKSNIANGHNRLGNIYFSKGRLNDAKIEYLEAIEITRENDGDWFYSLVTFYNNLGETYHNLGRFDQALVQFNQARALLLNNKEINSVDLSNNLLHLGTVYGSIRKFDTAQYFLKKSLRLRQESFGPKHPETAKVLIGLVNLYDEENLLDSALYYCQRSFISLISQFNKESIETNPTVEQLFSSEELLVALGLKGKLLRKLYLSNNQPVWLELALDTYELLDKVVDKNREKYERDGSKLFLANETKPYYENAIICAYDLYKITEDYDIAKKLYHFITKSKAMLLVQDYNSIYNVKFNNPLAQLIRNENTIRTQLFFFQKQLTDQRNLSDSLKDSSIIRQFESKIFQLVEEQQEIKNEIITNYSSYNNNRYMVEYADLGEILNFTTNVNGIVVEYFWGEKNIYVIAIGGNGEKRYILDSIENGKVFKEKLTTFLGIVSGKNQYENNQIRYVEFVASSYFLYENLLKDLLTHENFKNENKIKIIPDGYLIGLPFEALIQSLEPSETVDYSNLEFIIKKYITSYDYSSQFLAKRSSKKSINNPKLLGFSFSGPLSAESGGAIIENELPGSYLEVQGVMNKFKGKHFAGELATEQNFKQNASFYDILHLAIHGKSDPSNRFNSRLIFRNSKHDQEDDILYPFELNELKLNSQLVVLSACETGLGANFTGEGVFSMARGFMAANCPSIVQSFWAIDDKPSSRIMGYFYDELDLGNDLDIALRNAKLNFLKNVDGIESDPNNWAGFGLLGQSSTFKGNNILYYRLFTIISIGVLFFMVGMKIYKKIPG